MTEKSSVDCRTDTVERRIAVSVLSSQVPSSVLSSVISPLSESGGGRWIRTTEGVSQQIYSLPPLAAWVSLRLTWPVDLRDSRASPALSCLHNPTLGSKAGAACISPIIGNLAETTTPALARRAPDSAPQRSS